jgi:mitochondrial import inner membrane translocase subunit TIM21
MIRYSKHDDFEYKYFYLDVRGHPRIYLENADTASPSSEKKKLKLFGVNWR